MRAISLWQPWATAIAVGVKKIETRHWAPPQTVYGQRIAIHAAKRWGPDERAFAAQARIFSRGAIPEVIPLGAIIATCVVSAWRDAWLEDQEGRISPMEKYFGNYAPNRYAWVLTGVVPLPSPIPYRGAQGFFNVPDELLKGH